VLLYHAKVPGFAGGYVGVDVFFVISGFLITGVLLLDSGRPGGISLRSFYARRVRRILPAATVVILCTVGISAVVAPPFLVQSIAIDGAAAAVYLPNVRFGYQALDYLRDQTNPSPLTHFWSLGVEEQFYLFWPALMILVGGRRLRSRARLWAALVVVTVSSFAFSLWLLDVANFWTFYSLPTRAWQLALGGLLALSTASGTLVTARTSQALAGLGLAMILAAGLLFDDSTRFPGAAALLPTVGAAAIIAAGTAGSQSGTVRILSTAPFRWLGRISYSLYLWHLPVLLLPAQALQVEVPLLARIALVLLAVAIATVSWRYIEEPFRRGVLLKGASPLRVVGYAGASALVFAFFCIYIAQDRVPPERDYRWTDGACQSEAVWDRATCVYGEPASSTVVVLLGDSHAAHWFPTLEHLSQRLGWRLIPLTRPGCPTVDATIWGVARNPDTACDRWRESALQRVEAERPDLILVSASRFERLAVNGRPDSGPGVETRWSEALTRSLTRLQRSADSVALIGDTPRSRVDPPVCVDRHPDEVAACATPREYAIGGTLGPERLNTERTVADKLGMALIDPTPWICPRDPCEAVLNGVVAYADSTHISASYASTLADRFLAELNDTVSPGRESTYLHEVTDTSGQFLRIDDASLVSISLPRTAASSPRQRRMARSISTVVGRAAW